MCDRDQTICFILLKKCFRGLIRSISLLRFTVIGCITVFGGLYGMWYSMRYQQLNYIGVVGYTPLAFNLQCRSKLSPPRSEKSSQAEMPTSHSYCTPKDPGTNLSPTDILMNTLVTGTMMGQSDEKANDLANLLSSIMMNGLPMVGLDDFIRLSDFTTQNLGESGTQQILSYGSFQNSFTNFIDIRNREIRLAPNNCYTKTFLQYLKSHSALSNELNITIFETVDDSIQECCETILAIIEIDALEKDPKNESTCFVESAIPHVTIRMHPSSIPDTRNIRWSPRKSSMPRYQSGQLLYFLSGFLSLQLEIQNFLHSAGLGGQNMDTHVFHNAALLPNPTGFARALADIIVGSSSPHTIYEDLMQQADSRGDADQSLKVPLYQRAFPMHHYTQAAFWHTFGQMLTVGLIIYFSIPAAIAAGSYQIERLGGQLDVLSTIPGLRHYHSAVAWCLCCNAWCGCIFLVCWLFFHAVLDHTSSLLPSLSLFLCGCSIAPLSIILGTVVKQSDALVMAIPVMVFITQLPGMLYIDLAFDSQRSIWFECLLCLLPPSAAALVLREIFGSEALFASATWWDVGNQATITKTPLIFFAVIIALDCILYSAIAIWLVGHLEGTNFLSQSNTDVEADGLISATLSCEDISKSYSSNIDVLSHISTQLRIGHVYTLLGSNGAGKTTLMRILCGLDPIYAGIIKYSNNAGLVSNSKSLQHSQATIRHVGWCPQVDPLFSLLTVHEHIDLISNLLDPLNGTNRLHDLQTNQLLNSLDMIPHINKMSFELSGGMKRRLSLILALIGNPRCLLLDEPSSGCDSWTRELIRKYILARKKDTMILVSTHHIDDVEVYGDRILFLNDKYLAFDGTYGDMMKMDSSFFTRPKTTMTASVAFHQNIFFTTSDQRIIMRCDHFIETTRLIDVKKSVIGKKTTTMYTFHGHDDGVKLLQTFIVELESQSLNSWSIHSPSIQQKISAMYSSPSSSQVTASIESPIGIADEILKPSNAADIPAGRNNALAHIWCIFLMRLREILATWPRVLSIQILLPFTVVMLISLGCRDIRYPKVELSSAAIEGLGELPIGTALGAYNTSSTLLSSFQFLQDRLPPDVFNWLGEIPSGLLWDKLYKEYYHHQHNRWGAFVVDDFIPHWIETNVTLDQKSCSANLFLVFSALQLSQELMCGNLLHHEDPNAPWILHSQKVKNTILRDQIENNPHRRTLLLIDPLPSSSPSLGNESRVELSSIEESPDDSDQSDKNDHVFDIRSTYLCDNKNSLTFTLISEYSMINTSSDHTWFPCLGADHNHGEGPSKPESPQAQAVILLPRAIFSKRRGRLVSRQFVITYFQSLYSNLTIMSNVTADHAAPVLLKEMAPLIYSSLLFHNKTSTLLEGAGSITPDNSTVDGNLNSMSKERPFIPHYRLFSFPLQEVNYGSDIYTKRGYIGSVMIMLFILITTSNSVRMVTHIRSEGVKPLLHMAGLGSVSYWIGNAVSDSVMVLLSITAMVTAIALSGNPIRSYFCDFDPYPPCTLMLAISTAFAASIVSSSYAFTILSSDQLSNQLFCLLTTVVDGVFLKLFFDRHGKEFPYNILSDIMVWISPSYSYSLCLFELFNWNAIKSSVPKEATFYIVEIGKSQSSIRFYSIAMIVQAIAFLGVTIWIDKNNLKFRQRILQFQKVLDIYWSSVRSLIQSSHRNCSQPLSRTLTSDMEMNGPKRQDQNESSPLLSSNKLMGHRTFDGGAATVTLRNVATSGLANYHDMMEYHQKVDIGIFPELELFQQNKSVHQKGYMDEDAVILIAFTRAKHGNPQGGLGNNNLDTDDVFIECKDVRLQHKIGAKHALNNVTIYIRSGERVALMGTNGGGKSSLFRSIALSENVPYLGSIRIDRLDMVDDVWEVGRRKLLGYVPQERGLLEFLTVNEMIQLFYSIRLCNGSDKLPSERFEEYIATIVDPRTGILPGKYLHYPIHTLSGGNKKKLGVVLANLGSPRCLQLDECTSGVDPVAAEMITSHIKSSLVHDVDHHPSQSPQALLFASHRIDECAALCDRVIILDDGAVYFDGSIRDFDELATKFYQVDVVVKAPSGNSRCDDALDMANSVIKSIEKATLGSQNIERLVVYSDEFLRYTFEKAVVPLSRIWYQLEALTIDGIIDSFSFREMNLEEALSSIIASSKYN